MKYLSILTGLLFCAASATNAATINIDNFDTTGFQFAVAPTSGASPLNPATTSSPTPDAIGGARRITVERLTPAGTGNAFGQQVQAIVLGGTAAVGMGAGVTGTALFEWSPLGADLVDGTNSAIFIDILSGDTSIDYTLDINGTSVSKAGVSAGTLEFSFADFSGISLTNVSAISLLLSGPSKFDAEFDNIRAGIGTQTSAVPLPAGLPLLLLGIGSFAALRRRSSPEG
ncbi:MAG: VPLPA-CTERM sorting domain-containing protein [Aliishimia sp.]